MRAVIASTTETIRAKPPTSENPTPASSRSRSSRYSKTRWSKPLTRGRSLDPGQRASLHNGDRSDHHEDAALKSRLKSGRDSRAEHDDSYQNHFRHGKNERQRRRRIVASGLDRVDRLSGDAEYSPECGLGQVRDFSEFPLVVLDGDTLPCHWRWMSGKFSSPHSRPSSMCHSPRKSCRNRSRDA